MDRKAEIAGLKLRIRQQEAWGKTSVHTYNQLAALEAEERRENGQLDWGKLGFWTFAMAYCFVFWYGVLAGIWGYLSPLIHAMMNYH